MLTAPLVERLLVCSSFGIIPDTIHRGCIRSFYKTYHILWDVRFHREIAGPLIRPTAWPISFAYAPAPNPVNLATRRSLHPQN
jgi:hypothetical protein